MALLYESNGDWPDSDDDYNKLMEDEGDGCYFCDKSDCICDEVYDFAQEQELLDDLDNE